ERSILRYLIHEAGAELRMIGKPLQYGVREDQVKRLLRAPGRGVAQLPCFVRIGPPGSLDHRNRIIETDDGALRPAQAKRLRAVSGAASQVDDAPRGGQVDPLDEIEAGLGALTGEFQVDPSVPLRHAYTGVGSGTPAVCGFLG